jgi:hypothetical protein
MVRQFRTRQILRFRKCQRRQRKWIGFYDVADWIACGRGITDRRDEALRVQGYVDLLDAAIAGDFGEGGETLILYLASHAELRCFGLRRWQLESQIGDYADPPGEGLRLSTERLRRLVERNVGTNAIYGRGLAPLLVPHTHCAAMVRAARN